MDNNEKQPPRQETDRPKQDPERQNRRRPRGRYNNRREKPDGRQNPQSQPPQNQSQPAQNQPQQSADQPVSKELPSFDKTPSFEKSPTLENPQTAPGSQQPRQGNRPRQQKPRRFNQTAGDKNIQRDPAKPKPVESTPGEVSEKPFEPRQSRPKAPYNRRRDRTGRREQNLENKLISETASDDMLPIEDEAAPEAVETNQLLAAGETSFIDAETPDTVYASPDEQPRTNEAEAVDGKPDVPYETEIIGVRFKKSGKIYYFDPSGFKIEKDDDVIVETARGVEYGSVMIGNRMIRSSQVVLPLRKVLRVATPEDRSHREENAKKEIEAYNICIEKIEAHKLQMKLVDVEYTFDNNKLLFYFTADGRIDFRDLVKDLASVFRTRIELRQIGIRDEAKMMGGLGICGRPFCCHSFLADFVQVSIKMAKEQNMSLNSSKISGACGRLMCCLRYEYDTYDEEIRKTPPLDSTVRTPDGEGTVIEINPLAGLVKVRLKNADSPVKTYSRDVVVKLKNAVIPPRRDVPEAPQPESAAAQTVSDSEPAQDIPTPDETDIPVE